MPSSQPVTLSLRGVTALNPVGAFRPLLLDTTAGSIETRLYEAPGATSAILWLGDMKGGFDSPADKLYDRLAEQFQALKVISLRMQYRNPGDHAQIGLDALVGAFLLQQQGVERLIVVGHGMGALGAVQAGLAFPFVTGVAVLAPHPVAAEGAERLSPTPLLVLHGTEDQLVPTSASRALLDKVGEPKRIHYYQKAGHDLVEAKDAVSEDLTDWLKEQLAIRA